MTIASKEASSREGEMPLGLLQALQTSPPSWSSRTKVSAVGQGIACIDDNIPKELKIGVQCLYLSRNRIADLTGIQQFTNLRALSLASNEIATFEALLPLKELFHLEMAILCGNPIADLPFYRSHVISMLGQSLKRLDGRMVLLGEHETALKACEIESKVLDLAMSSACLLHTARMALTPQIHVVEATTLQSNNLTANNQDFVGTLLPPPVEEARTAAARWMMCQNTEEEEEMRHKALYTIRRQASHFYLRTLRTPTSSQGHAEQSSRCLMGWIRAYGEVILTYVSAIEAIFLSNQTLMVGEDDSRLKSCNDEHCWTKTIATLKEMACEMGRPGVSSSAETDAEAVTDALSTERCHAGAVDVLVQRSMALHSELLQYLDGNVAGQSDDWEIPAVTCCQNVEEESYSDMKTGGGGSADMSADLSEPSPSKYPIQDSPQKLQQTVDQLTIELEEERIATELLQRELSGQHELASALEHWLRQAQERAERAEEKAESLQSAAAMWEGQVELVGKYLESSMEEADSKLAALQQEIDELKAAENSTDTVNLTIRVFTFENEYLQEQQSRRNLEATLKDMEARLSSFSELLEGQQHAEKEYMQKVMLHWKRVAQREHRLHQFCCVLREVHNKRLGRLLLTSWQIGTKRSKSMNAVSTSTHRRLLYLNFQNWKAFVIASGIKRRLKEAAVSFYTMSLLKRSLAGWKERVVDLQDHRRGFEERACDRRKKITFVAWYKIVRALRERKRMKSKSFSELVLASLACQRGLLSKAFEAWERHTLQGALHRQATSQLNRTRTKLMMHKAFTGWQLAQKDRTRQLVSAARQRVLEAERALSTLQQRFDQVWKDGETCKQRLERAIEDRDAIDMQLKRANDRERELLAAKVRVEKEAALERARLTNDLAAARRQILECQHQLVESYVQGVEGGCNAGAACVASTEARVSERVLSAVRAVMGNDVDLEFHNAFSSLTNRYS